MMADRHGHIAALYRKRYAYSLDMIIHVVQAPELTVLCAVDKHSVAAFVDNEYITALINQHLPSRIKVSVQ